MNNLRLIIALAAIWVVIVLSLGVYTWGLLPERPVSTDTTYMTQDSVQVDSLAW